MSSKMISPPKAARIKANANGAQDTRSERLAHSGLTARVGGGRSSTD
ncbi:MAG TPA: hypothetical protein VFG19_06715 [Geobacteraceae bacterium]|nr:hypothetical protein [Geobacteraceae bacterium]